MNDVKVKRSLDIRTIAEIGITVALAAVLNLFPIYRLPQGGSISLDMAPLIFLSFYRGVGPAVAAGAVYGFVDYTYEPFLVHPAQFILDYPLAFGLVGLAGLTGGTRLSIPQSQKLWRVAAGSVLGGSARFISHFFSGVIFFASYAPKGQSPWLYSLVYNGSYMSLSTLAAIPVVYALLNAFKAAKVR